VITRVTRRLSPSPDDMLGVARRDLSPIELDSSSSVRTKCFSTRLLSNQSSSTTSIIMYEAPPVFPLVRMRSSTDIGLRTQGARPLQRRSRRRAARPESRAPCGPTAASPLRTQSSVSGCPRSSRVRYGFRGRRDHASTSRAAPAVVHQ
jgi:hypothetical protein